MMKKVLTGSVVSVHTGDNDEMRKDPRSSVVVDFEGFADDGHRSFTRTAYAGEMEPEGTLRRNDRQWSAVSTEELLAIQGQLELAETLSATDLGANLCVAGIPDFSRLPRGTRLVFPSGATLMVEAYNPPCVFTAYSTCALPPPENRLGLAVTAGEKRPQ